MHKNSLKNLTYRFPKSHEPWNKGIKGIHLHQDTEFKKGRKDDIHPEWKGSGASQAAIHAWVKRWKGSPIDCEKCGIKGKFMQWANIDHKYRRVLDDFISMCAKCHFKYDVEVLKSKRSGNHNKNTIK